MDEPSWPESMVKSNRVSLDWRSGQVSSQVEVEFALAKGWVKWTYDEDWAESAHVEGKINGQAKLVLSEVEPSRPEPKSIWVDSGQSQDELA